MFYVLFVAVAVAAAWFIYSHHSAVAAASRVAGSGNPVVGGNAPSAQPVLNR